MREIKFRAWDEANRVMEYNVNVNQGKAVKQGYQWFNNENTVYHSELMQYTGLKDKNGKEIYEGDILKAQKSISDETEVYFRVKYTGAAFALVHPEYHNTIYMEVMPWYVRETAEVIGNIYENPSLLEVSQE